jgi:hypothetical protein
MCFYTKLIHAWGKAERQYGGGMAKANATSSVSIQDIVLILMDAPKNQALDASRAVIDIRTTRPFF